MRRINLKTKLFQIILAVFSASIVANSLCFSMMTVPLAKAAEKPIMAMATNCSDDLETASTPATPFNLQTDPGHHGLAECCVAKNDYFKLNANVNNNQLKLVLANSLILKSKNIEPNNQDNKYLYSYNILPPPQLAALSTIVKRE